MDPVSRNSAERTTSFGQVVETEEQILPRRSDNLSGAAYDDHRRRFCFFNAELLHLDVILDAGNTRASFTFAVPPVGFLMIVYRLEGLDAS